MILHKNKVRLVNDVTSRRNPDSSSEIHLTADKVAQFRLVTEVEKKKNKRRKPHKNCISNKSDVKILINSKTL